MAVSGVRTRGPTLFGVSLALVLLLVSAGPASASGPDGRIQGFITDSGSGNPIAGASVRIEASDLPWAFTAITDALGYFEIAVPPHRYGQSVSSPAHVVNATQVAVGSGQTVWANMTLSPAASRTARLQGYVTDSVSSAPVTVGRIVARPWAGSFANYENASALNASGYFSMDLVANSYDIVTDGVIGYVPYDDYPVYLGSGEVLWYNISLDPNPVDSWINGTVYDDITSARIAGAQITARVDGLLSLPSVSSDASGRYALPVPSGNVELAADALGYAPTATNVYVWSGGGQYTQTFYLTPLSKVVRGYLADGVTGAPLSGVLVTVAPLFFDGYYDQATTNASGAYGLTVPDDYYVVSSRPAGYAPWSTWVIGFSGTTAWANGTLWPIVSHISGYIRDATDGGAVPGILVRAIDIRTSYQSTDTSDAFGFYSVDVPPSPAMSVWAYGQGVYAGNVSYIGTMPYATTWVNITLDRLTAQILANVTNAVTGLPVPGVSVIAAWFYGNSYGTTDANGSTSVGAPTGVDVYVNVVASGYDFWVGLLTPVPGGNALDIALWPDLPYDVHIRGYVRDETSGTGIWSVSVESEWGDGNTATAYTNSTGYYDLYTVAAPQTVQARDYGYASSVATLSPSSGEVLWVNLTLAADSSPPQVRSFTATPSTDLDPGNPAALLADVAEARLDRADLAIHMMYSALSGVGTFLNLGYLDAAGVVVTSPSNGTFIVSDTWDTRSKVARLSDSFGSAWWPVLTVSPFLAAVNGYYDDASLSSPTVGNAIFDTRDGRLLFVITGTKFIGPQDDPTATFVPATTGVRIDLTSAAILGYTLVNGPTFALRTLRLTLATAVPSGTYAAVLELRDAAGGYTQAAVLMRTVADTTPPVASAGVDFAGDEDAPVTFDGAASTDNVGVSNYTWTFTDGSQRTLYGSAPSYTFANPGTYVVTLTVRDAEGNVDTDTVTVVIRDVTDPLIVVSAPDEGLRFYGSLTVTANASDNVGIMQVELLVDGVSRGNDTSAPFEFVLLPGGLTVGNHTIEVIAYDGAGNSASEIRHVTVTAATGGPLLPDIVVLGGLGILALVAAVLAALLILRRRPRRPAMAPMPPTIPEATPSVQAPLEEIPTAPSASEPNELRAPDPDFDVLLPPP